MSLQTKYIAPYILRGYIWEILQLNLGWTSDDYDIDGDGTGYIPIVPLGEEPELEDFDRPFIVYGYAETPQNATVTAGNLMLIVYSTNFRILAETTNTILKTFESDWTVDEVNKYSSSVRTTGSPQIESFLGIRFGSIRATTLEGGSPEDSPGGRMSTTVNIRYEYISDYALTTSIAHWDGTKYIKTV